jgi:hypothetical protein
MGKYGIVYLAIYYFFLCVYLKTGINSRNTLGTYGGIQYLCLVINFSHIVVHTQQPNIKVSDNAVF